MTEVPVTLVAVPFEDDVRGVGMGTGPLKLIGCGELHAAAGSSAPVQVIDEHDLGPYQLGRMMEIDRRVAERVRDALAAGGHALVVAGYCHHAHLGSTAALRARWPGARIGVIWFDAHADFDTPEIVASGFFDSMGMTVLTGGTFNALAARIPGFDPIEERNVLLAGVRDLRDEQWERLRSSAIVALGPTASEQDFQSALDALLDHVDHLYVHVDLDCLDPSAGRANAYAAHGGLGLDVLLGRLDAIFATTRVTVASVTAYDAELDAAMEPTAAAVAVALARHLRGTGAVCTR